MPESAKPEGPLRGYVRGGDAAYGKYDLDRSALNSRSMKFVVSSVTSAHGVLY